eukprot:2126046-Alexandrium_andersonii.AAC.1
MCIRDREGSGQGGLGQRVLSADAVGAERRAATASEPNAKRLSREGGVLRPLSPLGWGYAGRIACGVGRNPHVGGLLLPM